MRLLGQKRMWIFNITNPTKILSKLPHIFLSTSYQHSLRVPVSPAPQPTLNKFCTFLFVNLISISLCLSRIQILFILKARFNIHVFFEESCQLPSKTFFLPFNSLIILSMHSTNICEAFIICSSQSR